MPEFLADLIVLIPLGVILFFVIRSMIRSRKKGGGCSGDCSSCGGCKGCHK